MAGPLLGIFLLGLLEGGKDVFSKGSNAAFPLAFLGWGWRRLVRRRLKCVFVLGSGVEVLAEVGLHFRGVRTIWFLIFFILIYFGENQKI